MKQNQLMDDNEPKDRSRKLAGREKTRRHPTPGRSYLHAMTNSRVKRTQQQLEKAEKRARPDESGHEDQDSGPSM